MIPYILKTLQTEKYVFIERLGAFRTQLKHAVIEKNVIHPPYNEVVFSQNDSEENNFALANQISREKKCLFTEANELVMKWVDELLAALQNNKSVTYEGFGTFMLDKKGNISFESAVVPQLNSQFEGMEPIDIRNVAAAAVESVSDVETEDDEAMKDDETMNVVETVKEPEPEPVVEAEPVAEAEDDEAMKDEETMKVVETVKEPEPEPVVEAEPVAEAEDDEAMKDEETMNVVETVEEPEAVGANNDSPEEKDEETMNVVETVKETEPVPVVETEPVTETEDEETMKGDETMNVVETVEETEPVEANNDSSEEEEDEDDDDDDDDDDEEDEKKRHGLAWLWVVLLLLLALGALGYVFKDRIWNYYQQWKDKRHPVEQEIVPEVTDEADQTAVFEEEPVVEEETAAEETPEVVEETVPEPVAPAPVKSTSDGKYNYVRYEQGRYYVIVGSFPTESDAEKHIRNKKLGQYSPVIVKQDGVKNLRVCIGVFDTEAAAEQFAKNTNQNYWILK